jgi:hypothetical protein
MIDTALGFFVAGSVLIALAANLIARTPLNSKSMFWVMTRPRPP